MPTIERLTALEVLDSRGRPTVQATCQLASGATGTVSVPSGASAGKAEALQLRDGDPARYQGLGCRNAVRHVQVDIQQALAGQRLADQRALDEALIALDDTPDKARLGGNALLAVSLAFARACAADQQIPLFRYFASIIGQPIATLPLPMINLFSGGKHAGGQVSIQDIQVMPIVARTIDEVLSMTYAVFQAGAELALNDHGMRTLTADEGGLAPGFASSDMMLAGAVRAIERAGFKPGEDVVLTVDVAASHFYEDGVYRLEAQMLDGPAMVDQLVAWTKSYPIVSLEDGLDEEDWDHWRMLCNRAGRQVLILGDDFLCTNPARVQQAIEMGAANALLLKPNQIGTLSEAADAYRMAKDAGWQVVISARSGETEDNWLADLSVGWSGEYIKVGSINQSERLAKYNRLLAIEQAAGLPLSPWQKH